MSIISKLPNELQLPAKAVIVVLLLLVGFVVINSSVYQVDQSERGVILRNGKTVGLGEPGLGFKIPFIDKVARVSVQTHSLVYNNVTAYSHDQQPAKLIVSVTYTVMPAQVLEMYSQFKTSDQLESRIITRQVGTQAENVFGQYSALDAVRNRPKLVADLTKSLREGARGPVTIESVQIENIDFSDAYEKSVEDRMSAEVGVQTQLQNLEKEKISATIAVARAQAVADSALAQATADAKAIKLKGDAEAGAIRAKSEALQSNPNLVEYTKAARWNGVLPTTMLPNAAIPFLQK